MKFTTSNQFTNNTKPHFLGGWHKGPRPSRAPCVAGYAGQLLCHWSQNVFINSLECNGNHGATSNNMKLVHWTLTDGLLATFGTARRVLGGAAARPAPPPRCTKCTAHPSTASVPLTRLTVYGVLLYNGPLLCGFNVAIKG